MSIPDDWASAVVDLLLGGESPQNFMIDDSYLEMPRKPFQLEIVFSMNFRLLTISLLAAQEV